MTGILVTMFFGQPFGGLIPGARGAVLAALMRTGAPLTGRQIHSLVGEDFSLWSVQAALKDLAQLGVVETHTVGRAGVHAINEQHVAVAPLRSLADPFDSLRTVVSEHAETGVEAIVIFGSVARGEATETSDIDLAVIADGSWNGQVGLEDAVRSRLGNECDVLVFSPAEFAALMRSGEPVVADIVRDGVTLVGSSPRANSKVA